MNFQNLWHVKPPKSYKSYITGHLFLLVNLVYSLPQFSSFLIILSLFLATTISLCVTPTLSFALRNFLQLFISNSNGWFSYFFAQEVFRIRLSTIATTALIMIIILIIMLIKRTLIKITFTKDNNHLAQNWHCNTKIWPWMIQWLLSDASTLGWIRLLHIS